MANHKSAAKRAKQTKGRTLVNKMKKSTAKSSIVKLRSAIEAKNKDEAQKLLVEVQSNLALAAKNGAIKSNTASRKTSRLSKSVAAL